jgi:hypothetical protein
MIIENITNIINIRVEKMGQSLLSIKDTFFNITYLDIPKREFRYLDVATSIQNNKDTQVFIEALNSTKLSGFYHPYHFDSSLKQEESLFALPPQERSVIKVARYLIEKAIDKENSLYQDKQYLLQNYPKISKERLGTYATELHAYPETFEHLMPILLVNADHLDVDVNEIFTFLLDKSEIDQEYTNLEVYFASMIVGQIGGLYNAGIIPQFFFNNGGKISIHEDFFEFVSKATMLKRDTGKCPFVGHEVINTEFKRFINYYNQAKRFVSVNPDVCIDARQKFFEENF